MTTVDKLSEVIYILQCAIAYLEHSEKGIIGLNINSINGTVNLSYTDRIGNVKKTQIKLECVGK